jgi:hypothetical protein
MATVYNQQLTAMLPVISMIILLLLPLSVGAYYLHTRSERRTKALLLHRSEVVELRKKFYRVADLRFSRKPLIVRTSKEVAYYNKLIVHYKNSTRKVEHIGLNLGEDKLTYSNRVENYMDKFCSDESEAIEQGQKAYDKYFEKLNKAGALDYFKNPCHNEKSKEFIYAEIDFLLNNPKAEYGSYKKANEVFFL